MSRAANRHGRAHADRLMLHALQALPAGEASGIDAHLVECADCRREMEALQPVIDSFADWPANLLRPTAPLWDRLAQRIGEENGEGTPAIVENRWKEPEWKEASPGLWYQLLAVDDASDRVTMLVRLEPGVEYPPHEHAGLEELHLLDGELWIDDRKLHAGDYNRAKAGTGDKRVWSETGCTCLLITSHRDVLK